MAYLWTTGQPIKVTADRLGVPKRFKWETTWHEVEQVAARWRVDEGWWRSGEKKSGQMALPVPGGWVWREYFRLVTTSGLLVDLYRDMVDGGWYLQSVYD